MDREMKPMYRIKPWEELTIQDDYMFKLIMGVKRICLSLLQSILHVEIADIHYLETEKSVDARYQGKGIRMDVYVRDDANTVYNIEMQEPLQARALLSVDDRCRPSGDGR